MNKNILKKLKSHSGLILWLMLLIILSAGSSFAEGKLKGWGRNSSSELGLGDYYNPEIAFSTGAAQVATGYSHTLAITTDGALYAWGYNGYGQLGDGGTIEQNSPKLILSTGVSQVAAGSYHSLILKTDGSVWAFGRGYEGQIGDGSTTVRYSPVEILSSTSGTTSIGAGANYSFAILSTGEALAWGDNDYGQLGDGSTIDKTTPTSMLETGISSLSAGYYHTVAVKTDGSVWTWGYNYYGQLGDGTSINRSTPAQVVASGVSSVASGYYFNLMVKTDGSMWSWGRNSYGQLGNANFSAVLSPAQIVPSGVSSVYGGADYSMMIKTDGSLWTWGRGYEGQLGDGQTENRSTPAQVLSSGAFQAATFNFSSFLIKTDGSLHSWGANGNGQLGLGRTGIFSDELSSVEITSGVEKVAGGGHHTLVIKENGALWSWGENTYGQLGDGSLSRVTRPKLILSSGVSEVEAGYYHSLIVKTDGSLWSFGRGNENQLGDGAFGNRTIPFRIISSGVDRSAAGYYHSLALKTDGSLWTWGDNFYGQLGNGTSTDQLVPTSLISSGVIDVAAGFYHTIFVKSDGSVWSMGYNNYGQLGDGSNINRRNPVQVMSSGATKVFAGAYQSYIIKNDGSLWSVGYNNYGQLGDGTTSNRNTPIRVIESGVVYGESGYSHALVSKEDGSVWSWGRNGDGQIGDGTWSTRYTPVQVVSSGIEQIGATFYSSFVIEPPVHITSPSVYRNYGSAIGIQWTTAFGWGDADTISLEYTSDDWATSNTITSGLSVHSLNYNWDASALSDLFNYQIRISTTAAKYSTSPGTFGVDRTVPSVILSYDNSPALAGTLLVTATYSEAVTSAPLISINQQGSVDISGDTMTHMSGMTVFSYPYRVMPSTGSSYIDGLATVSLSPVSDDAGNPAGPASSASFTIDTRASSVTSGLEVTQVWGVNSDGQLGLRDPYSPETVLPSGVSQVANGEIHTLILKTDGSVWAMGYNGNGALGDGSTTQRTSPVQIIASGVTNIAAGYRHSLAVKTDGSLWAWGYNNYGQLGNGNTTQQNSPILILSTGVSAVAAGYYHSYALMIDGSVKAFGYNNEGQLGDGTTTKSTVPVTALISNVSSIASGGSFGLAGLSDGSLQAWGYNVYGQIGDATTVNKSTPVEVISSGVSQVAAGLYHSSVIKIDGSLWTWGYNVNGRLGDGTTIQKTTPVEIISSGMAEVVAGNDHTLARGTDGSFWAWGYNGYGQLGDGTTTQRTSPVQQEITGVADLGVGAMASHSTMVDSSGALKSWGRYNYGQLGTGYSSNPWVDKSSAQQLFAEGVGAVAPSIGSGENFTLAVKEDGSLWSWGRNSYGQLGLGHLSTRRIPSQVLQSGVRDVKTGYGHSLMLKDDGSLWAWGYNNYGQLGDGSVVNRSTPVQIYASGVTGVAAGLYFSAVVKSDGSLWTWGYNAYGQLGDGGNSNRNRIAPMQILSSGVSAIQAGESFLLVLKTDGSLWSVGYNGYGQLGNGNTYSQNELVQAISSGVVDMAAGLIHSLAVKSDGSTWAWGYNGNGNLGRGDTLNSSVPVKVVSVGSDSVGAGAYHSMLIKKDGSLWTWGRNSDGELGDSTVTQRTSPVKVIDAGVTEAGGGYLRSFASVSQAAALTLNSPMELSSHGASVNIQWSTSGGWANGQLIDIEYSTDNWTTSSLLVSSVSADALTYSWDISSQADSGDYLVRFLTGGITYGTSIGTFSVDNSIPTVAMTYSNNTAGVGDQVMTATFSEPQVAAPTISIDQAGSIDISTAVMTANSTMDIFTYAYSVMPLTGSDYVDGLVTVSLSQTLDQAGNISSAPTGATFTIDTSAYPTPQTIVGGTLKGWGYNTNGELGIATEYAPVVVYTSNVSSVGAGASHSFIVKNDGSLWATGSNSNYKLGDGTTSSVSTPIEIISSGISKAVGGISHSVALGTDGSLWAWGYNGYGQLGMDTSTTTLFIPTQVMSSGVSDVVTGQDHTVVLKTDGSVWTFGRNSYGQLGDGSTISRSTPTQVIASGVVDIGAGHFHSLAVNSDGTVYAWGYNSYGGLGNGTTTQSTVPVIALSTGIGQIEGGYYHTIALTTDNRVFTWGNNAYGQLGNSSTTNNSTPTEITTAAGTISISAGDYTSFCTKSDGSLWGWGRNNYGQLGINSTMQKTVPVQVIPSGTIGVVAGSEHTLLIKSDGSFYSWGRNSNGQLGNGLLPSLGNQPNPVDSLVSNVTQVSMGDSHSMMIQGNGSLWTWGYNGNGQLGNGTTTNNPVPTLLLSTPVLSAVGGANHTMAILEDGSLWTWGYNGYGQLGDGTTSTRTSPLLIFQSGTRAISAGVNFSVALKADGSVWAWGDNTYGQLGDGSSTQRKTPVQVLSSGVVAIGTGDYFSLALKLDGSVWAFGRNNNGQLGDGSTNPSQLPIQVISSGVKKISVGDLHSLALMEDGSVWAWGSNSSGRLGDGSGQQQNSPVRLIFSGVRDIEAGGDHSVFLKNDGSVWAAGYNGYGQLGDGTTSTRNEPIRVIDSGVSSISAGSRQTMALLSPIGLIAPVGSGDHSSNVAIQWTNHGALSSTDTIDLEYSADGGLTYFSLAQDVLVGSGSLAWDTSSLAEGSNYLIRFTTAGSTYGRTLTPFTVDNTAPTVAITYSQNPAGIGDMVITATYSEAVASTPSLAIDQAGTLDISSGLMTASVDQKVFTYTYSVQGADGSTYIDGTAVASLSSVTDRAGNTAGVPSNATFLIDTTGGEPVNYARSGALYAWGSNGNGELGLGTDYVPTEVLSGVSKISLGGSHGMAVMTDGALLAWGLGTSGQLGDGNFINRSTPVQVYASGVLDVACGGAFSLILKTDGSLWSCGYNGQGQLGNGSFSASGTPVQVFASGVSRIATGRYHSLAVKTDGSLWAWGNGGSGQLGDGGSLNQSTPLQVISSGVSTVSAGESFSLASKTDGSVWSFGYNFDGQLGDGTAISKSTPVQVISSGMASVESGYYHSMAIGTDGSLWLWGNGANGRLGNGSTADALSPFKLISSGVVDAEAGASSTYFVKSDGSSWAMGYNGNGDLGNGSTGQSSVPVSILSSGVSSISGGSSFAGLIKNDGSLMIWGYNIYGQLANGVFGSALSDRNEPTLVMASGVRSVHSGGFNASLHTLVVKDDGSLWSFGDNNYGELGIGSLIDKAVPVMVMASGVGKAVAGEFHSLALRSDGSLWAWGRNNYGQLGVNFTTDSGVPVQVMASDVIDIAAGDDHSLALKNDGSLWAWGYNVYGQLGDGTNSPRRLPVKILESGVVAIEAGSEHSMIKMSDGSLWAFGRNNNSQLGDGTTTDSLLPILVSSTGVEKISGGQYHSAMVKNDGDLWVWGDNGNSQLGLGHTVDQSIPVLLDLPSMTDVSTGYYHTLAIRTDGSIWGWGYNYNGQVGDVSTVTKQTPVRVWAGGTLSVAAAGYSSFAVITNDASLTLVSPTSSSYVNGTVGIAWTTYGSVNVADTLDIEYSLDNWSTSSTIVAGVNAQALTYSWDASALTETNGYALRFLMNGIYYGTSFGSFTLDRSDPSVSLSYSESPANAGEVFITASYSEVMLSPPLMSLDQPGSIDISATTMSHSDDMKTFTFAYTVVKADGNFYLDGTVAVSLSGTTDLAGNSSGLPTNPTFEIDTSLDTASLGDAGKILVWGYNSYGQLGDGTSVSKSTPTEISFLGATGIEMSPGGTGHSFLKVKDGSLWGTGYNWSGQLGLGAQNTVYSYTQIFATGIKSVSAGSAFSLYLKGDGSVWGSGSNWNGELGTGTSSSEQRSPVQSISSGVVAIAAGGNHSLAVKSDGSLWAWGGNGNGQLGDGTFVDRYSPVQIATNGFIDVSAGAFHSLALKSDGSLWSWGNNNNGELGDSSTIDRSVPIQVLSSGVVEIAAGDNFSMVLMSDGSVWAWGDNFYGQVGDGTNADKHAPVQVIASEATHISVGNYHALVIKSDTSLWSWGYNSDSQLGDGGATNLNTPLQVIAAGVLEVAGGSQATMAKVVLDPIILSLAPTNGSAYGDSVKIQWNALGAWGVATNADIEYTNDNWTNFGTVVAGVGVTASTYTWDTSAAIEGSYAIRFNISGILYGTSSGTFLIDHSAPSLTPLSGTTLIPASTTLTVDFSEAMNESTTLAGGARNPSNYSLSGTGSNGAVVSWISGTGAGPYTLTLSGVFADGSITLTMANMQDLAGNALTGTSTQSYLVDGIPPTVSAISPVDGASISDLPTFVVTFSESVDESSVSSVGALYPWNYTLSGVGSNGRSITSVSGSGAGPYTLTLSGTLLQDSTVTLNIANVRDIAGNPLSAVSYNYTTIDSTPPVVSSTLPVSGGSLSVLPTMSVTFDEVVNTGTGVGGANNPAYYALSGSAANGVSVVSVSGSGAGPYTLTLSGVFVPGALSLSVNQVADTDSNTMSVPEVMNYTVLEPISLTAPAPLSFNRASLTIQWTTFGFWNDADRVDIQYTTDSFISYSTLASGIDVHALTHSWDTSAVPDDSNYLIRFTTQGIAHGTGSGIFSIDNTAPSLDLGTSTYQAIYFDEVVNADSLTSAGARFLGNYSVTGVAMDGGAQLIGVSGSGAGPYYLVFDQALDLGGIAVVISNVEDLAGNPMASSETIIGIVIDETPPLVLSVSPAASSVVPADVVLSVTFNEAVSESLSSGGALASSSYEISGTAVGGASILSVSGSGAGPYSMNLSQSLMPGTLLFRVGSVKDVAGNIKPTTESYGYTIELPETTQAVTYDRIVYSGPSDYRLVSFPFTLPDSEGKFLLSEIKKIFGTMSDTNYQIYGIVEALSDYVLLGAEKGPKAGPGYGYWLATIDKGAVSFDNTPGPVFGDEVRITLHEGWNIVGNPYREEMSANHIYFSSDSGQIQVTDTSHQEGGHYFWIWEGDAYSDVVKIKAGQGCFVYSNSRSEMIFKAEEELPNGGISIDGLTERVLEKAEIDASEPKPPAPPGYGAPSLGESSSAGGGCMLKSERSVR